MALQQDKTVVTETEQEMVGLPVLAGRASLLSQCNNTLHIVANEANRLPLLVMLSDDSSPEVFNY